MPNSNVLQPLDVNSPIMERSPARKRARYEPSVKERWSLTHRNSLQLDEVFDCGVAVLDSDSETQSEEEANKNNASCVELPYNLLNENLLSNEICDIRQKQSEDHIALSEWENYLIKRPDTYPTTDIDCFTLLSDEVILHIFHFLPKKQLPLLAPVCHRFHRLSNDDSLWARMDVSSGLLSPGALGFILSRQVVILRLSQTEIQHPIILSGCRAAEDSFSSRLLYLDLSMVHVSKDSLCKLFDKCQRLKKVSLESVTVNADVMKSLSGNKELEVLNLTMAIGLDLKGFQYLLKNCVRLRELNLAWTLSNNTIISYICSNLPNSLDRINLSGCRKLLNDKNVQDLVKSCPGLRELDLSDCTAISGHSINYIVKMQELNFLSLSRCYLIPLQSLLSLRAVETLVYLDLHGGYINNNELQVLQGQLGSNVHLNKFKFSSVARPTVGNRRSSIWNLKVRD